MPEDRTELLDTMIRALIGRVYAQGQAIELLLGMFFGQRPELTETVMRLLRNSQPDQVTLSDQAAELYADVVVQSRESLEALLARANRIAQGLQAGVPGQMP